MNIISNDGSNKLNRSRKARVSYKVQRTINASLNAATSTRAVSSNPNFVTRQKIEIIFGRSEERRVGKECRSRWGPEPEIKTGVGMCGLTCFGDDSSLRRNVY